MSRIMRFEDIVNNMNDYVFHMLGCGAIGSSAAIQLARCGADKFCLYDYDKVEEQNVGVSHYNMNDIGKYKVNALENHILSISERARVYKYNESFSEFYHQDNDIVILGFDSMKSRRDAVEEICQRKKEKPYLLIDGRMGGEHYQQYVFTDVELKSYMDTWYSDEDGDPEPCNIKATSYCSNMAGSLIVNAIRKIVTNSPYETFLTFNFPTMSIEKKTFVPTNK